MVSFIFIFSDNIFGFSKNKKIVNEVKVIKINKITKKKKKNYVPV
jgi:hypothetical protein